MGNLFKFLKKFRNFLIFIGLQAFIISLFLDSKNYHKASFVNSTNIISSWVLNKKHNITNYFELEEINTSLAKDNANLLTKSLTNFHPLQNNIIQINDKLFEQQFELLPSIVINYSKHKLNNYGTINKGKLAGVEKEMGVIVNGGIVGFIIDVSEHYSIMRLVLSENINLTVEVNNIMGNLDWKGRDQSICHIKGITSSSNINVGDSVITKGSNGHFPRGIFVGVIDEAQIENGAATLTVSVKLSTNFDALSHVFIVKNRFKNEYKELEESYYE